MLGGGQSEDQTMSNWWRCAAAMLSCALCLAAFPEVRGQEGAAKSKFEAAMEIASQTGRPVLAVGTRDTCGLCKAFLAELQSDRQVRLVASQFVPVQIDIDEPAQRSALARYRHDGNVLPVIWIIRADGEQLYGHAGAPERTAPFLAEHLKRSGTLLSGQQLAQLTEAVEKAQSLVEAGKIEQAVPLLKRYANSGSYAAAAVQMDQLAQEVASAGKSALEAAEQGMQADSPSLDAALAFVEVQHQFGSLPELTIAIRDKAREYRKDEDRAPLLAQAELFHKAQQYAAEGKIRQAASYFQGLKQQHPGTPAAERAEQALAELDNAPAETTPSPRSSDNDPKVRQAASYLRFGKTFHFTNADNARKYYEKAIEAAPNSEHAAEARKLLSQLD